MLTNLGRRLPCELPCFAGIRLLRDVGLIFCRTEKMPSFVRHTLPCGRETSVAACDFFHRFEHRGMCPSRKTRDNVMIHEIVRVPGILSCRLKEQVERFGKREFASFERPLPCALLIEEDTREERPLVLFPRPEQCVYLGHQIHHDDRKVPHDRARRKVSLMLARERHEDLRVLAYVLRVRTDYSFERDRVALVSHGRRAHLRLLELLSDFADFAPHQLPAIVRKLRECRREKYQIMKVSRQRFRWNDLCRDWRHIDMEFKPDRAIEETYTERFGRIQSYFKPDKRILRADRTRYLAD